MNTAVQCFQTAIPKGKSNVHLMIARLQKRGSVAPLLEEHNGVKSDFYAPSSIEGDVGILLEFPKSDFSSRRTVEVKSKEEVDYFQVATPRKQSSVRQITKKIKKIKKKSSITPMPATKTAVLEDDTTVDTHVSASSMAQQYSGTTLEPPKFNLKLLNKVEMKEGVGALMDFFPGTLNMDQKPSQMVPSSSRNRASKRSKHDNRRLCLERKQATPQNDSDRVLRETCHGGICVRCNNLEKTEGTQNKPCSSTSSPSVRFGRVEIRKYPVVLDDRACSSGGPALTLGWTHTSRVSTCVCSLERRRAKAAKRSFRLTREGREKRLMHHGYTELELAVASRLLTKRATHQNLPSAKVRVSARRCAR